VSSVVDRAVSEQGFLKSNDDVDGLKIDCFEGDDEAVVNVDVEAAIGDEGGESFISARLRLTPCSTGSNSSERLRDATANMMMNNFETPGKERKEVREVEKRKKRGRRKGKEEEEKRNKIGK